MKKLGIASNNESYVINALQFLGIIDEKGKRTPKGQEVFTTHEEDAFKRAFETLIKHSYKDLFDIRGDDAWTMNKGELIGYFRKADQTSDVIGTRQAAVFQTLRGVAGREALSEKLKTGTTPKSKTTTAKQKTTNAADKQLKSDPLPDLKSPKKDMALTVRVKINLPAEASAETYDNIFKSIRANLLNE